MLANNARSWTLLFAFFSHTTNCTAKLILNLLCIQCQDLYSTRWWRRSTSHHGWHWRSTHGWSWRPAYAWRHSRWGSHSRWSSHPPWRTSLLIGGPPIPPGGPPMLIGGRGDLMPPGGPQLIGPPIGGIPIPGGPPMYSAL